MAEENQHGLSRYIPAEVKREVRQRSKFGCVICRRGFYQYEHIDPPFEDAKSHNPDHICCLCGACHDAVTRGQVSKGAVKAAYSKIQSQQASEVGPPVGPLDFHDGTAELVIGGLAYSPAVRCVLRYHGWDLIHVLPGASGEPGQISAVFTNERGEVTLQLVQNEWVGSLENWDIEIVGQRITVRPKRGEVSLQLRLDPPGRIVVERLDMRFRSCHVLVSEHAYAIGRYITESYIRWVHAVIEITKSTPGGCAIELTDPEALQVRYGFLKETGSEMANQDRSIIIHWLAGVMAMQMGISIASMTGEFKFFGAIFGESRLSEIRPVVFSRPDKLHEFMTTGKIT